jgi:hypothetical protein
MNITNCKSSSRNSMNLVDRYVQAVRFWVPKAQQDLIAEMAEDLRSQIEAKEAELDRPLDESEVSAILKRCGAPMVVAGRLGSKQYLIGPTLFPIYVFVLKMVLLWILLPIFIFIIGPVNLGNTGGDWGLAVARTFGDLWSGLFVAAGMITLVFAILERTQVQLGLADKWDPRSLPPLRKQERKPTLFHSFCEAMFSSIAIVWLLLLPHYSGLILGPARAFLQPGLLWHTFYIPILLVALVGFLRPAITMSRPQWPWFPHLAQLVQTGLTLILVHAMLNASIPTVNGDWHPFVVLTDAARNSAQYIRVAAIVNVSILISLASTWLGLSIAGVIQTWQFLQYLRKKKLVTAQPASLQAQ